jgi:nucleoside-diphosphate-sugar epimerase
MLREPRLTGLYRANGAVMSVVLVTGGSGFIASYCILQLLAAGHQVGTTVRSLKRESDVRAMLKQGGAEPSDRLKFFAAELEQDAGWREAVTGCDYVLHVASPLSQHVPKNEDEMIVPARDGTLRVLRAARDAGVKRVVLTSSFTAIGYGHLPQHAQFNENVWTDLRSGDVLPYAKSKTLAERAAWDFIANEGGGLELSVSIRCWCSVRCLDAIFRPRSCSCSACWKGRYPAARASISASWTSVTSPTCTCAP